MSLLLLQNELIIESVSSHKVVKGFIQHIHPAQFSVICYNEPLVCLYHEVAKYSPLFCDATGTIVALPKKNREAAHSVLLCNSCNISC